MQLGAVRLGPSASSKGRPHAEGTGPVGSAKLPRTDGTQNEAKVGTEMNKVCYARTRTRTRAFPEVGAYQDEGGSGPHTPNRAMSPAAENQINQLTFSALPSVSRRCEECFADAAMLAKGRVRRSLSTSSPAASIS